MKKLYRRSISGLLALLICFTAILGSGMTAYAAAFTGETADSYSVAFPRDGDANLDYSGTWGHDELHYMNGWTSGEATWMTTLHTMRRVGQVYLDNPIPIHQVHSHRRCDEQKLP